MIDQKNVPEKIKFYRKKLHISQEELSKRSGIHVSTIKKYECGLRNPKPAQLSKIAAALGVSNNALWSYDVSDISEVASRCISLHQQGLIKLEMKKDADGNYIPESISVSSLDAKIRNAIAASLRSMEEAAQPAGEPETPAVKPVKKVAVKEPVKKVVREEPIVAVNPKVTAAVKEEPAAVAKPEITAEPEITAKKPVTNTPDTASPKEETAAPESLDGAVGTGRILLKNMDLFQFKFNSTMKFNGQDCLTFDWKYKKQGGIAIIRTTEDGGVEDTSSLTCRKNKGSFRHPLSIQKDRSLNEVFEKMLASRK